LIDKNSNTVITKVTEWVLSENILYYISFPKNCRQFLNDIILRSSHPLYGIIDLNIKVQNKIQFERNSENFVSFFDERTSFYTYKEIFYDKIYESSIVKVSENDVVVDIGANLGFFSIYANSCKSKKIISIEPDFKNFITLLENTHREKNILCHNFAISNKIGIENFVSPKNEGAISHLKKYSDIIGCREPEEFNVICMDINSIIKYLGLKQIDYLKLDCEGAELDIFREITRDNLLNIKKISLEFHSNNIKNEILEKLRSNGFEIENMFYLHGSSEVGMILSYNSNIII
jgi:FkbM family methyltransferase